MSENNCNDFMNAGEADSDHEFVQFTEEFLENEYDMPEFTSPPKASTSKQTKVEQKDVQFMTILARVGGILLSKSLTPATKREKKKAAEKMAQLLLLEAGEQITPEQIIKKVANAKQRIKLKVDMKKTGNLPIKLKESEKILLDCLHSQDNPGITEIKTGLEVGVMVPPQNFNDTIDAELSPSSSPAKKKRKQQDKPAADEITTLQEKVLREQLDLIRLQKEMFQRQEEREKEKHIKEMEILELKKKTS